MTDRDRESASGNKSETLSAIKDTAIGLVAKTLAAGAVTREAFVHLAANAVLYEIAAAEIALQRARREPIRAFARDLQGDYQKMGSELRSFLGGNNTPQSPPDALDLPFQALIDDLNGAADGDFDGRYIAQQQSVHSAAITLFNTYQRSGSDRGLTNLCGLGLPVLEHNHEKAEKLAKQI